VIHDVPVGWVRKWAYKVLRRRFLEGEQLDLFEESKLLT